MTMRHSCFLIFVMIVVARVLAADAATAACNPFLITEKCPVRTAGQDGPASETRKPPPKSDKKDQKK